MVKNWADHDSSDEEDLAPEQMIQLAAEQHPDEAEEEEEHYEPAPPKTYDFPSGPPYTAFVGNVAYNITKANELGDAIQAVAKERLNLDITVVDARIMMERKQQQGGSGGFRDQQQEEKPRHRGFGYVTVETLDQLKGLMGLNDGETMMAGRKIQLDTANQQTSRGGSGGGGGHRGSGRDGGHRGSGSSGSNVDGSKFRGGRFGNSGRGDGGGGGASSGGPPGERPRLKLQARSKPVEEAGATSNSSIFGAAKPRDEQSWAERRKSEKGDDKGRGNRGSGRGDKGGRGRGDKGGRGAGRSSGRGGKDAPKDAGKKDSWRGKKEDKPAAAAAEAKKAEVKKTPTPAPVPEKPVEKKVVNKFAVLGFDDSDSD